jgi:hypothetical protein
MIGHFYMEMCKNLLLLGCVYCLFDESMQNSIAKPILVALIPFLAIISGALGYCTLSNNGEEDEEHKL